MPGHALASAFSQAPAAQGFTTLGFNGAGSPLNLASQRDAAPAIFAPSLPAKSSKRSAPPTNLALVNLTGAFRAQRESPDAGGLADLRLRPHPSAPSTPKPQASLRACAVWKKS